MPTATGYLVISKIQQTSSTCWHTGVGN